MKNKSYVFKKNWLHIDKGTIIVFNHDNVENNALYEQMKNNLLEIDTSDTSELTKILGREHTDDEINKFLVTRRNTKVI